MVPSSSWIDWASDLAISDTEEAVDDATMSCTVTDKVYTVKSV